MKEPLAPVKMYTKTEFADLYGISISTLRRRMEPFITELDQRFGYNRSHILLSIPVVKYLFEEDRLGWPSDPAS